MVVSLIERIYALLWGDLIHVPLPGGDSVGISLLIILLIPTGIYFSVRTKVLPAYTKSSRGILGHGILLSIQQFWNFS